MMGVVMVEDAIKNRFELPPGALIYQVAEGSGAAKAGLHGTQRTEEGDIALGMTSFGGYDFILHEDGMRTAGAFQ